jgi:hypothetical protein
MDWNDIDAISNKLENLDFSDITNAIAGLEVAMTNGALTNLTAMASDLQTVVTGTTNILVRTQGMDWNAIGGISNKLENLDFSDITNAITDLRIVMTNGALTNLTAMASDLQTIETSTTDILASTQNINWNDINNISNLLAALDLGIVTGAISDLKVTITNGALTNLTAMAVDLQDISSNTTNLLQRTLNMDWADITDLASMTQGVSNDLAVLEVRTRGMDWQDVMDVTNRTESTYHNVTNVLATIDTLGELMSLTNLKSLLVLTTAVEQITSMTNLTDLGDNVTTILSDINGMVTQVETIQQVTDTIDWKDVQSIINQAQQISDKTDTIDWRTVTQIFDTTDDIKDNTDAIEWSTVDAIERMSGEALAKLKVELEGLQETITVIDSVHTEAEDAATQARGAKALINNVQGSISSLETVLGDGNADPALSILSDMREKIGVLQGEMQRVTQDKNLNPIRDELMKIATEMGEFAKLSDLDGLIEIPWDEITAAGSGQMNAEGMVGMANKIEEMKAMLQVVRELADKAANEPIITDWYEAE